VTDKAHRAIIEIPEGFESNRLDQASTKTLVANDGYLIFRYKGTYGSFSENTWKGPKDLTKLTKKKESKYQ
jgi:hypothetical protein